MSDAIIAALVTDRTVDDVEKLLAIMQKPLDQWTAEESDYFWYGNPESLYALDGELFAQDGPLLCRSGVVRGAYNSSDFNRVGIASLHLYQLIRRLGYNVPGFVPPKTDWLVSDIPSFAQKQNYISNIQKLKSVWNAAQQIPNSMDNLDYIGANNIEKLLSEVDRQIESVSAVFVKCGAINAFCGTSMHIREAIS